MSCVNPVARSWGATVDLDLHHGQDLQTGRANSDGDGDAQQLPGDGAVRTNALTGDPPVPDCGMPSGTANRYLTATRQPTVTPRMAPPARQRDGTGELQQDKGSAEPHRQLDHSFDHLTDGSGDHVALSLEKAPEGADHTHQQCRRTQTGNGSPCVGLLLEGGKLMENNVISSAPAEPSAMKMPWAVR